MAVAKERDDEFLAHGKKHPRHDVTLGHGRDRMKREQWPLEWPAVHEHEVGGARPIRFLVPDRIEALGARAIEDEAEGPALIVLDEQDHRPGKVRVVQFRSCDEQMSGERTHQSLVEHGSGGGGDNVPHVRTRAG